MNSFETANKVKSVTAHEVINRSGFREIFFPKIQIQGKWLDELGFHIGDRLTVEYEKGAIHIRSAEPEACMVSETTDYQAYGTGVGENLQE